MILEHKSGPHNESKEFPKIVNVIQCSFIIILVSIKILIVLLYKDWTLESSNENLQGNIRERCKLSRYIEGKKWVKEKE